MSREEVAMAALDLKRSVKDLAAQDKGGEYHLGAAGRLRYVVTPIRGRLESTEPNAQVADAGIDRHLAGRSWIWSRCEDTVSIASRTA